MINIKLLQNLKTCASLYVHIQIVSVYLMLSFFIFSYYSNDYFWAYM